MCENGGMAGREGRRKTPPRRSTSFHTIVLLTLLPIGGLLLHLGWRFFREHAPAPVQTPVTASVITRKPPAPRTTKHRGDIVLILDDVGFDHQPVDGAMRIDPNINFAVVPNGHSTREDAETLHAHGFEVLCHLPMEPHDFPHQSAGPGAVMTSMSDGEIAAATIASVRAVPFARGVNNHMGSRATADRRVMTDVLGALPKGMYFIDSRTTSDSVAEAVAKSMRIPTTARNVFLDNVQQEAAIRQQLAQLTALARERGIAVGIGHIYPITVKVLTEDAPKLRASGFRFVRASTAVN
jgi:polysaccharide deacetylase 2 family uncharacterized protein YibQ